MGWAAAGVPWQRAETHGKAYEAEGQPGVRRESDANGNPSMGASGVSHATRKPGVGASRVSDATRVGGARASRTMPFGRTTHVHFLITFGPL